MAVAEAPEEIKSLFGRYSENGLMDAGHLQRFLVEIQMQSHATIDDANEIIDSLHEHKAWFHKKGLNQDDLFKYLFGDINLPVDVKRGVHNDMTAPMSHYYIYTGHNSYLTGNQLSSDCSDEPIIQALKNGVRVIELDIWPNSAKDDINVLHGRTLTTPVKLTKCLNSIKKHAFETSEYPVILTLEDHLTADLQAKLAEMLHGIFGDDLYFPETDYLKDFPSLESLKRRVMISTKPPKEYLQTKVVKETEGEVAKEKTPIWGKEISYFKFGSASEKIEVDDEDEEENGDEEEQDEGGLKSHNQAAPEYKRIIAIHSGKPKGGIDEWLRVDPEKVRRVSISEQQARNIIAMHWNKMIRFSQRNMLRIYPKGIRIDSSNFNPVLGWSVGAQMVAFNMQGYGRSLWVMQGMFRANGGCGYVKKPDFLLKPCTDAYGDAFDPRAQLPVKTTLKVKVYMGEGWDCDFRHTHFDMFSPPDFYARVGIEGVPADSVMKKTKTIEDSWVPVWNEDFEFPLSVPELALLRVEVHEYDMSEKDDFGGQSCLLVSEIRQGIRCLPLRDEKGIKYNTVRLLMRFEFV